MFQIDRQSRAIWSAQFLANQYLGERSKRPRLVSTCSCRNKKGALKMKPFLSPSENSTLLTILLLIQAVLRCMSASELHAAELGSKTIAVVAPRRLALVPAPSPS